MFNGARSTEQVCRAFRWLEKVASTVLGGATGRQRRRSEVAVGSLVSVLLTLIRTPRRSGGRTGTVEWEEG